MATSSSPRSASLLRATLGLGAAATLVTLGGWAAESPAWRVERGDVRVVCPLTVGGSFEARTSSLEGVVSLAASRPAAFTGDLSVDLSTLDSGIDLRNHHLREEYLEVGKGGDFAKAVLSEIHLGDVDGETFQGRTSFSGSLRLHGEKRTIAGEAEVRREGRSVRVEASFPVTLGDYGIAKPQYLGVGVKGVVQVKVSLVAAPVATRGGGV